MKRISCGPQFVHSKPYPYVGLLEPQLTQQLRRLARRPFSPRGGERFDHTVSYCMQHERTASPEEEHDLPPWCDYGRFEDSMASSLSVDPVREWALSNL